MTMCCCVSVGGLSGSALWPDRRLVLRHRVQDLRQLSVVHEQLSQPHSLRVPVGAVPQELPAPAALPTVRLVPAPVRPRRKNRRADADGKSRPSYQHSSGVNAGQRST